MTDPTPLYYQTPPPNSNDISNLKVLSILHYVWGGILMLISCIFILYIVLGVLIASGLMKSGSTQLSHGGPVTASPALPPAFGYMFAGFGSCGVIVGWAIGICTIISGRKMAQRKSRIFSIVMAGVNCISFPLGTTLGVFTIIVLSKQSVKDLYAL